MKAVLFILVCLLGGHAYAEESKIEDNSFLLEEAFNQEWGVYQFIQSYQYNKKSKTWDYGFENEIPIADKVHQLSYEIPYQDVNAEGEERGIGDAVVSYRWQPINRDDFLMADRFGLIVPTGDEKKGRGNGVFGIEFVKAATIKLNDRIMNHWNFGVTYLPKAKFDHSFEHDVVNTSIGTSLIYLLSGNVNLMFEALQANDQSYTQEGLREIDSTLTLNPGVRFALNFDNLQIVPGISLPYEVLNKEHEYGLLVYLSIEPKFY